MGFDVLRGSMFSDSSESRSEGDARSRFYGEQ